MAGAVVSGLGVVVLVGARRGRDRVLGVHQGVESVVWLGVRGGVSPGVGRAAVVVLPTLVPVGVLVAAAVGAAGCVAAWRFAFASTWCAYAAVLSVLLLVWIRRGPAAAAGSGAVAGPGVVRGGQAG